jgi:hypothetical protein
MVGLPFMQINAYESSATAHDSASTCQHRRSRGDLPAHTLGLTAKIARGIACLLDIGIA